MSSLVFVALLAGLACVLWIVLPRLMGVEAQPCKQPVPNSVLAADAARIKTQLEAGGMTVRVS